MTFPWLNQPFILGGYQRRLTHSTSTAGETGEYHDHSLIALASRSPRVVRRQVDEFISVNRLLD